MGWQCYIILIKKDYSNDIDALLKKIQFDNKALTSEDENLEDYISGSDMERSAIGFYKGWTIVCDLAIVIDVGWENNELSDEDRILQTLSKEGDILVINVYEN